MAESFAGLADPNRVKILSILLGGEMCVGDLALVLGVSESAVSQHLRILRGLRWVKNRKEGRVVFYSLNDEHVRDILALGLRHSQGT
jgi:DNA-binding transcriptional ArsR family regulator